MVTDQVVLTVGYDRINLDQNASGKNYQGEIKPDWYGRPVPKHAHGTANLPRLTSSARMISKAVLSLYDRIVDPDLLVRRLTLAFNHVVREDSKKAREPVYEQLDLFSYASLQQKKEKEEKAALKERKLQEAILKVKGKYGKNAILKGTNLEDGATTIERNKTIGGHKA